MLSTYSHLAPLLRAAYLSLVSTSSNSGEEQSVDRLFTPEETRRHIEEIQKSYITGDVSKTVPLGKTTREHLWCGENW